MKIVFLILIAMTFGAGYFLPTLQNIDKKMEFAPEQNHYVLTDCLIENNQCQVNDYEVTIIDGSFQSLEKTTFIMYKQNTRVKSPILVTSDDKQFGTLISQHHTQNPEMRQVLIPFCGNPVMNVILIDQENQRAVRLLNNLSSG